jgi:hypothetical protein
MLEMIYAPVMDEGLCKLMDVSLLVCVKLYDHAP